MNTVRLIRHGESAANAGAATQDHAGIPLTARGIEQAQHVALSFTRAPDLIVTSPFSRAQSTASATLALYPETRFETWPVQEFTYLAPLKCVDTTVADRRHWVDLYWSSANPAYTDGPGAESFEGFISRARTFLARLAADPAQDIAVFSHGQFINAVAWLIQRQPPHIDATAMRDWRAFEISHHVANGAGYQLSRASGEAVWRLGVGR